MGFGASAKRFQWSGLRDYVAGGADLAYATRAALLPVFAVREPEGHFRVVIDPPLEVQHQLARRESSDVALRDYAARLKPFVLDYPGQWRGWLHV